jgi:tetratricopeptide (TPR) repeat protein
MKYAERAYPEGHSAIASYQNAYATVLQSLGELSQARDLLQLALTSIERSYPPGHPNLAAGQSNLATVLLELRELAPARDLLRKALASWEQSYPPGHPHRSRLANPTLRRCSWILANWRKRVTC